MDSTLDYASRETPQRGSPVTQSQILTALFAPWPTVILLLIWSAIAIRHFQQVEGKKVLWAIDPVRNALYVTEAIDIPWVLGTAAFLALPLFFGIFATRRRLAQPWRLILALIISEALAFVVLASGLMSGESVLYP
ncbi:MAG TPA: hypothetical protein VIM11_18235 [Tepidisphaeraceae bacterium]